MILEKELIFYENEPDKETADYTGEDGLLYCGVCHKPREAFFANGISWLGSNKHPKECDCQRKIREEQENRAWRNEHMARVEHLKQECFFDPIMREWTFENDTGGNAQMEKARAYVKNWEEMKKDNLGLLLWGGVGTGKSYLAGCIANALLEQEVRVRMTNFATILNDLNAKFDGKNEYIQRMCSAQLLIIDDFGMERGTEYGLEQVYNVIDTRYRSKKPLIVTTNLPLEEMLHPTDTAHSRIYDRLLAMCSPVCCTGSSLRQITAREKLEKLSVLMMEGKSL